MRHRPPLLPPPLQAPLSAQFAWTLALLLLASGSARGDLLVPKSGPKVTGQLVKQDEREVLFNPYWSPNPAMTWEVVKLTPDQVKKLEIEPHPEPEFFRRLYARKAGDTKVLLELHAWAKEHKLKPHAEMAAALAAAEAPGDAAALAALGGAAKLTTQKKGNPQLDGELAKALTAYAGEADPLKRLALQAEFKTSAPTFKPEELERLRRSALQPKGRHDDVPLSIHADRHPGAVYTVFVPQGYDPTRPWPLLIGLHGGGPDGKGLDEVVGSGDSAMNFYDQVAAKRGVLVACPNAIVAGWSNQVNEDLVRALIVEMRLLYNVDIDRIHLTGHSMGGFGTWALGPKLAEIFATISPMAGAGGGGVSRLVETKTPIFIYHSADDFIDVNPDRQAAKQLKDSELDFIYTELNGQGHGYPDSIRDELFEFLLPRRNFDPAYKDAWPRSSLLGKVSPDEKTYLGDPLEALGAAPALEAWLSWIRVGGGRARAGATALGAAQPVGAGEGLAKLLKDEKTSAFARAEAARAAGLLGAAGLPAAPALRKALGADALRETSTLVKAAAQALSAMKDPEAAQACERGVAAWTAYFESKLSGSDMRFSDWTRSLGTLAKIVESWGALGDKGAVTALEKGLVQKVLALTTKVETSERVPQDPSQAFVALAQAVAKAYAAGSAPAGSRDALLAACAHEPKAVAAVTAARR